MESYAAEKVEMNRLIKEIMKYFDHYYDNGWKRFFETILTQCHSGYSFKDICRNVVGSYRGGMGSFDDYILSENGYMPVEENNEFDALKNSLFGLCNNVLLEGIVISFKQGNNK